LQLIELFVQVIDYTDGYVRVVIS